MKTKKRDDGIYHIIVNGTPVAQPRTRACVRGKRAAVYDPGTADAWKTLVALAARHERPDVPISGPVEVRLLFRLPRPNAHYRDAAPNHCTRKPDVDNLAKAVLDVLTRDGWWADDAQVVRLEVIKAFAPAWDAGVVIQVREVK